MPKAILIEPAPDTNSVPIRGVTPGVLSDQVADLAEEQRAWVSAMGFSAKAGEIVAIPGPTGEPIAILFGLGTLTATDRDPLIAGWLARSLPSGTYRLATGFSPLEEATLAFGLGSYRYDRFHSIDDGEIRLEIPVSVDSDEIRRIVDAVTLARDLINTPANLMGPAELSDAARGLAEEHHASCDVTIGEALLRDGLPLIHAVGAAAGRGREPRLIDLKWGDDTAPKVTLVGKGVCFDTGGLDIKSPAGMLLMKKDMAGAAHVLALASMIMSAGLPVRLRVLIPAVENAIAGAAFRPGDILASRKGLTVEIGNTDAEGRLVLADALTLASEESPDLIIDFATLTGAARAALGPEIPAVFTADDLLAEDLAKAAAATADPIWRLPLWHRYGDMLKSQIADINNTGKGGFAGSITAAVFLSRFVSDDTSWLHADIFGWTPKARPASPEGGEAQAIRAVYHMLKQRYRPD